MRAMGLIRRLTACFGVSAGLLLVLAVMALALLPAPRADAMVYWTNGVYIGRANLDGSGANPNFLFHGWPVSDIAVTGTHIYWSTSDNGIYRAPLTGGGGQQIVTFMHMDDVWGITVVGNHVYWTDFDEGAIKRANVNGYDIVEPAFVTGLHSPHGIDSHNGYIYWNNGDSTDIGRVAANGTGLNTSWGSTGVPGGYPTGLAVNGAGIFWGDGNYERVGRLPLSGGTGANPSLLTGTDWPNGIALLGNRLFVGWGSGPIGAYNVNGSAVKPVLVDAAPGWGIDVDWIRNTGHNFQFGKFAKQKKKGRGRLTVRVPGPGKLVLTGKGLRKVTRTVRQESIRLNVRPKSKRLKRKLRNRGKATLRVKVTFWPDLGPGKRTKGRKVTLVRKR